MKYTISNPVYKKNILTNNELDVAYRVRFKNLGINSDSITEVMVSDANNHYCDFFIIDNDTLILEGGDDFFQLKRSN